MFHAVRNLGDLQETVNKLVAEYGKNTPVGLKIERDGNEYVSARAYLKTVFTNRNGVVKDPDVRIVDDIIKIMIIR